MRLVGRRVLLAVWRGRVLGRETGKSRGGGFGFGEIGVKGDVLRIFERESERERLFKKVEQSIDLDFFAHKMDS